MTENVSIVTGASRGLGRGTARALGGRGGTVYVTGRSIESLAGTVSEIEQSGGRGIAVECDHRDDEQVAALFERVKRQSGCLDLLVNNAAAIYGEELGRPAPFWEKSLKLADILDVGLRSSYVAAWHAAPLMIAGGRGLIANISFYGAVSYTVGPAYGAAKAGSDKMAWDMGIDLADTPVSVVSFWPGYIMTDELKQVPKEYLPAAMQAMLPDFESPEFTGLILAAMQEDPDLKSMSGRTVIGATLAQKYGIRDLDGKQPRDWREIHGSPLVFFNAEG